MKNRIHNPHLKGVSIIPNLGAAEFSEYVISTLRKIEPNLRDNVMKRHPSLDFLKDGMKSDTGRALVVPLGLGEDTSTEITDRSGTFNTGVSDDIMGAAEYLWSDPIVSHVRLRWKDLQENSGKQQLFDRVRKHIDQMQYNHGKKLVEFLHNRMDLGEKVAGQFEPLDALFGDATYDADPDGAAGQPAFTVGGISTVDQPLWQATRLELPVDGQYTILEAIRQIRNEVYVATSSDCNLTSVICGRSIFEEFEDQYDGKVRYENAEGGQTKFTELRHGDLVFRLDPDCPPRRAYFLDKDAWVIRDLNGNFMKTQPAQQLTGTLDYATPSVSVIALGVNERRAGGLLLRPTTAGGDA